MPAARCLLALVLALSSSAFAARIGTIPPAQSLTADRVAALPVAERAPWMAYLARSDAQRAADRAALAAERQGMAHWPAQPDSGSGAASMPLDKPAAWYGSEAARAVVANILSFQTPSGGWGKNQPRDRPPRQKGQGYVADNNNKQATPGDFDAAQDARWTYVGTVDNDATITEIRFLAKAAPQLPADLAGACRQAAERGLRYLLAAQFPNGGWPQVWPLQGGYHDAITFNDNAVVEVAELMAWASRGEAELAFLPADLKAAAGVAYDRAVQLLLATQVRVNGRLTLWGQQHDPLTLAPSSARNYEPPALSAGESARALEFLMQQPDPSPALIEAVRAGASTLRELAVRDRAFVKVDDARRLVDKPGAGPIWARYYDAATLKPVFGDRDKSLHDDVNDISAERRNGYNWWGSWGVKALAAHERWEARRAR